MIESLTAVFDDGLDPDPEFMIDFDMGSGRQYAAKPLTRVVVKEPGGSVVAQYRASLSRDALIKKGRQSQTTVFRSAQHTAQKHRDCGELGKKEKDALYHFLTKSHYLMKAVFSTADRAASIQITGGGHLRPVEDSFPEMLKRAIPQNYEWAEIFTGSSWLPFELLLTEAMTARQHADSKYQVQNLLGLSIACFRQVQGAAVEVGSPSKPPRWMTIVNDEFKWGVKFETRFLQPRNAQGRIDWRKFNLQVNLTPPVLWEQLTSAIRRDQPSELIFGVYGAPAGVRDEDPCLIVRPRSLRAQELVVTRSMLANELSSLPVTHSVMLLACDSAAGEENGMPELASVFAEEGRALNSVGSLIPILDEDGFTIVHEYLEEVLNGAEMSRAMKNVRGRAWEAYDIHGFLTLAFVNFRVSGPRVPLREN